jgi:hypothetical protein
MGVGTLLPGLPSSESNTVTSHPGRKAQTHQPATAANQQAPWSNWPRPCPFTKIPDVALSNACGVTRELVKK